MKNGVRSYWCVFHWVTFHLKGNWSTFPVLLDHCQNIFDTPHEDSTSPCIYQQIASNVITGIYLEHISEYQTSQVLKALLLIPCNWPWHFESPSKNTQLEFLTMPKAMKKSTRELSPPPSEDHDSTDAAEASGSDQERDPDVSFCPAVSPNNFPTMFMPYIEGPKMNWTVDDGLYHRFWSGNWNAKQFSIANWQISLLNKNA